MPAHKIIFRLGLVGVAAVGTASIAVSAPALGTAIRGDDTVPDKFRDPNREEVHIKASKLNNPFSQRVIPINSRMDNRLHRE